VYFHTGLPIQQQSRDTMNSYFSQLEAIVKQKKTSNRIRFMIQNVMDLRRNQWKPRCEDNNPKTIEQIHKDAERERTYQSNN
jgi:translation initiation factor 4G